MTVCIGNIENQRKEPNGYHLKTTSQNHNKIDVHIWETWVHMCTKYEVSMSNHVPGGGVHTCQHKCRCRKTTMHEA